MTRDHAAAGGEQIRQLRQRALRARVGGVTRIYHSCVSAFSLRKLSVPPLLFDAGLAVVLGAVGIAQLLHENERRGPPGGPGGPGGGPAPSGPDALSYLLLGLCAASLVVRQRRPLLTLLGVTGFGAIFLVRGEPVFSVQLIVLVAIYSVVADSDLGRVATVTLSLVAAVILGAAIYFNEDPTPDSATWAMDGAWVVAAIFLGDSVRSRRESAAQQEQAREEASRRRVADERLQIARELHDVVGHNISLISVQAGAGAHVLYRDPDQARETFDNIRNASHETLQELRSLVGVLRDPATGESLTPTVGLDALEPLIKTSADTGQDIELRVTGTKRHLSGIVDLSAYRVLQEALTNTVRHAPDSKVTVTVDYGDDAVSLSVTNDRGNGAGNVGEEPGAGHGIAGMRERVLALGGRLDAGPDPSGGFHVRAVLPLAEPSP